MVQRWEAERAHLEHVETKVDVERPEEAAEDPHGREDGVLPNLELVLGKIPLDVLLPQGEEKTTSMKL